MSFFPRILLFQQPFFYNVMYIVLPLLDTLTGAPIHTLHTHPHTYLDMHGRHVVCDYGVFVHMCVFVYECEACSN